MRQPRSASAALRSGRSCEPGRETERLIPFVGAYVDEVSLERRRITVDWGLDY